MIRPRAKQMIAAVTFCVISLGLILAIWVVLVSGGGRPKAASAAPSGNNLTSPLPNPNIGPVGALGSVGGMPAMNTFAARQLPAAMHVQATLSTELQRGMPEPRLVRSFPSLSGGYIRIPVFIPGSDGVAAADEGSRAPVAPIILLGSAAGWSYLALSGSDRTLASIGNAYGSPSGAQPAAVVNPGSNPGNPPGNSPPGYTVARSHPGNTPGNNPPGANNNQGNPQGDKPGNSGNQGGNSPGNSSGNNGGNAPGGPPGYGPGNNPGNSGNNPGNSSGNNAPNGGNPPILPADVPDDLPVTTTPEPVSLVLLGSGLAAVAAVRNRRRKK